MKHVTQDPDQKKVEPPRMMRHRFTKEEDAILMKAVQELGDRNFKEIQKRLPARNIRQIKARYVYCLKPNINRKPWTHDEDLLLQLAYNEIGPKWAQMAKYFDGRTAINIKNRYTLVLSKREEQAVTSPLDRKRKFEASADDVSEIQPSPPIVEPKRPIEKVVLPPISELDQFSSASFPGFTMSK